MTLGDDGIMHITAVGDVDEKIALETQEALFYFRKLNGGRTNGVLIDLTRAGKSSPEARRIWRSLSESENPEPTAFCGAHPVARILASFMITFSSNKNLRFFKKYEDALAWIKSQSPGKTNGDARRTA